MNKVTVCRENLPIMPQGNSTKKHVHRRVCNPALPALIADPRSLFVINGIKLHVGKPSQMLSDATELRLLANSRKHLLPYRTQQLNVALLH